MGNCFKNTRQYPVKIVSNVGGGVCKVAIYGIKEEKEYDITIQSETIDTISYTTNYINDDSLEEGKEIVEQYGHNGYKSITYKITKLNGVLVSKEILSSDTYSPLETIIKKGTKKEEIETLTENIIDEEIIKSEV